MNKRVKAGILLAFLLGAMVFSHYELLKINPFKKLVVDTPSMVLNTPEGGKLVVDRSGNRFYKIDSSKKAVFMVSGKRNSDIFYEAKQMVMDEEGAIYLLDVQREGSRRLERERILKYSSKGSLVRCVEEIAYEPSDLIYKNTINRLFFSDGELLWIRFTEGGFSLMSEAGELEFFPYEDAANLLVDFALNPADRRISYLTKTGEIYTQNEEGIFERVYCPKEGDGYRIPWYMSYDQEGMLCYADIGQRALYRLGENGEPRLLMTNYSNEYTEEGSAEEIRSFPIFYTFDMGEQLLTTDGYGVVAAPIEGEGIGEAAYESEYGLSGRLWSLTVFTWVCAFVLVFLLLCGVFWGIRRIVTGNSGNAKIVASLFLVTAGIIVLFTMIILRDWNLRMTEEMTKRTESISGMAAELIPGDSIKKIDSSQDYLSGDYEKIRRTARNIFVTNEKAFEDLYCTIYRIQDGMITALYSIEDYVGAVYPYDWPYEGSDEQQILTKKEQITYTGLASSEGSFIFTNSPILDSEGNAVGIMEVGTNLYNFRQQNKQIVLEVIISAAAIAVAAILIIFEILVFFEGKKELGVTGFNLKKIREKALPASMLRLLVFLIFFVTNMPKGFLPIYILRAAETENVYGLSPAMLVSIALSAEVLFGALMSFGGNVVLRWIGRRKAALLGSVLFVGGLSMRALIPTILSFIGGNAIMGTGWGILLLIVQILIAEKEEKEKAEGFTGYTAASLSGVNCGVVFGAFLVNWMSHRAVLGIIGVLSGLSLVFCYMFIHDRNEDRRVVWKMSEKEYQMSTLKFLFSPRVFLYFGGIVIPVVAGGYFLAYLYPLFGESLGISETNIGYSYLLNGICIICLGNFLTRALMKKLGKKEILLSAALLYAGAFFLYAIYPGVLTLLAALVLLGISDSYGLPMQSTYYTALPEVEHYGYDRAMGVYSLFENMAQVFGSFIFGIIYLNGVKEGLLCAAAVLLVLALAFEIFGGTAKRAQGCFMKNN